MVKVYFLMYLEPICMDVTFWYVLCMVPVCLCPLAYCAAILVLVIGALYGAISGYCGGKVDAVMQRIVELIYAVPEMLVVLLIATALKPILTELCKLIRHQSYESPL